MSLLQTLKSFLPKRRLRRIHFVQEDDHAGFPSSNLVIRLRAFTELLQNPPDNLQAAREAYAKLPWSLAIQRIAYACLQLGSGGSRALEWVDGWWL